MVSTDQIIKELCLEVGDPDFVYYNRFVGGVIDGIRDLSIYNMPSYSHEELEISSFNSVEWPCWMVKPLVTCLLRDGKCVILDVDDDIVKTFPVRAEDTSEITSDRQIHDAFNIDGFYFGWYANFNWGLGEVYGLTSYRAFGYVTHDRNTRSSSVTGNCLRSTDSIVMFGVSNGLKDCPKFVPDECKTAIEHYALYKYYRSKNPSISELNLKNYKENFTRINKFYTGDDIHTWVAAMNSNTKSSPR